MTNSEKIKPIKIYGESKTGTTYLQHLLELNTDAEILAGNDWSPLGWKHGFPQHGDVTYIFIVRDIYEWAKSLIVSHKDKRFNGLQNTFGGTECDFWNVWNNPIECRTAKYYSYLGFAQLHDSILVNLDYLRKRPSCIAKLVDFGYEMKDMQGGVPVIHDIEKHTYIKTEGKDNPKRRDLTPEEIAFIGSEKDANLEAYVNKLTIE